MKNHLSNKEFGKIQIIKLMLERERLKGVSSRVVSNYYVGRLRLFCAPKYFSIR